MAVSEFPLEAIFNDKLDRIKHFERENGKNPAPIKLSLWKDFQINKKDSKDNSEMVTVSSRRSGSISPPK